MTSMKLIFKNQETNTVTVTLVGRPVIKTSREIQTPQGPNAPGFTSHPEAPERLLVPWLSE